MPKKRLYDVVQCQYFRWRLRTRNGVWQADGRSNRPKLGQHTLETNDREEALRTLHELDRAMASRLGLAPPAAPQAETMTLLSLEAGRELYESHIKRPYVLGGVTKATQKRYRPVFDKFVPFAKDIGVIAWNQVTQRVIDRYAGHLEETGYAPKTIRNEAMTLVQAHNWLQKEKHVVSTEPLHLTIRKQESESAYCYTADEVRAMIEHCSAKPELQLLRSIIIALACTGLRISELASLRWTDIDSETGFIRLTDETGRRNGRGERRRTKNGKSRSIPIHDDLAKVLQTLPRTDKSIFRGVRGGRLKPDTIRTAFVRDVIKPLAKRFPSAPDAKGFADGRLHSFRHFFCSLSANNGTPERMTMAWLGHQDSEMVKVYYHLHDREAREQMAKLNPLSSAGKQRPGNVQGAVNNQEDAPSRCNSEKTERS